MFESLGAVHDTIEAKVSPGGGNGGSTQSVVDDLAPWPGEHIDGIGSGMLIDRKGKDQIILSNRGGVCRFDKSSVLDRGERLHERSGLKLPFDLLT